MNSDDFERFSELMKEVSLFLKLKNNLSSHAFLYWENKFPEESKELLYLNTKFQEFLK